MARRSSARLRERNASTPQRSSNAYDEIVKTPQTLPARLAPVDEDVVVPGSFPTSNSPKAVHNMELLTPAKSTSPHPAQEEMHPQRHHQSTAKPLDEARHLGFSNMIPQTEPAMKSKGIGAPDATPTRSSNRGIALGTPSSYAFTFRREHSLQLSPEAKRLMSETREEAAKIRAQMNISGEAMAIKENGQRKIAQPKGFGDRFGQAHMQAFKKMDSIAGHASAFRADPNRIRPGSAPKEEPRTSSQPSTSRLKRKQSKAELDSPIVYPTLPSVQVTGEPTLTTIGLAPSLSGPSKQNSSAGSQLTSPAKRVKISQADDTSSTRRTPIPPAQRILTTPRKPLAAGGGSGRGVPSFASPTRASSTRNSKVGTSKIPSLALTPGRSKAAEVHRSPTHKEQEASSTPLLSRSPVKGALFSNVECKESALAFSASPFLSRSPCKLGSLVKPVDNIKTEDKSHFTEAPLLAQSPTRLGASSMIASQRVSEKIVSEVPLLAKSPSKSSIFKMQEFNTSKTPASPSIPLLARSPSKVTLEKKEDTASGHSTLAGSAQLADRFLLLRQTPVKSILRSPQRLYSDDPAKVAAGTHLATPPRNGGGKVPASLRAVSTPMATQKRVEFTSSTKAREKESSETPEDCASPTPKTEIAASPAPAEMPCPDLALMLSPSPQKRRKTATPQDFTFQVGNPIVFGPSPRAPPKSTHSATIRRVSMELAMVATPAPPITGSKKRKLDFESSHPAGITTKDNGELSDKENDATLPSSGDGEDARPTKRIKASAPSPAPARGQPAALQAKSAVRRPTLGVKPKKGTVPAGPPAKTIGSKPSRPATISRERLNALSQPKRR